MFLFPGRYNVTAKEPLRDGKVKPGMRGYFSESTPALIRANNRNLQEMSDEALKPWVDTYAPYSAVWGDLEKNDPLIVTVHRDKNDPRLLFDKE